MDVTRPSTRRVLRDQRSAGTAGSASRTTLVCAFALLVALLLAGCSSSDEPATTSGAPTTSGATSTAAAPTAAESLLEQICTGAPRIDDAGTIASPAITEASGLVASHTQPGVWWIHNDSGDSAAVYAIDDTGALLDTVTLDGATAQDWEDIAIGPGPAGGDTGSIYVGDIGDNAMLQNEVDRARDSIQVYRFDEPTIDTGAGAPSARAAAPVEVLTLVYPDGPHDAEAMLVDPIDGDLLLVTKNWERHGESQVYRAPAGLAGGSTTTLEHVGTVTIEPGTLITGADVSADGTVVALRSYGGVDLYERPAGEPLWSAFEQTPCVGPVPTEIQGESIGFASDGASYLTVSEGEHQVLHRTTG